MDYETEERAESDIENFVGQVRKPKIDKKHSTGTPKKRGHRAYYVFYDSNGQRITDPATNKNLYIKLYWRMKQQGYCLKTEAKGYTLHFTATKSSLVYIP